MMKYSRNKDKARLPGLYCKINAGFDSPLTNLQSFLFTTVIHNLAKPG